MRKGGYGKISVALRNMRAFRGECSISHKTMFGQRLPASFRDSLCQASEKLDISPLSPVISLIQLRISVSSGTINFFHISILEALLYLLEKRVPKLSSHL